MFAILFFTGITGFLLGLFYWIPSIVPLIQWTAPLGLGLLIIGGVGMWITSRRHQMKKLKSEQVDMVVDDAPDEGEIAIQGKSFQDYITSPEEGTTVYTLFLAGVVIIIWGVIMLFRWFRAF